MKIQQVVPDGLLPVHPIVCAWCGKIGMRKISIQQLAVELLINPVKEIRSSAIKDQRKGIGCNAMKLVNNRVRFPPFGLFGITSQAFGHVPIEWKRTDVYPSCCTSGGTKDIQMAHRQKKCPMSAHT